MYSIILLNYDPENKKEWVPEVKERVEENSKNYDWELVEVRDVVGYVNAVNEGFKRAKGDWLVVLNDDVFLDDPRWLEKLSNDNAITSWRTVPFYMNGVQYPDGSCWCLSRETQEKVGPMDEAYGDGYGCDEVDYFYTAREKGVRWMTGDVELRHGENLTYQAYFNPNKEAMTERNARIFFEKWKNRLGLKSA